MIFSIIIILCGRKQTESRVYPETVLSVVTDIKDHSNSFEEHPTGLPLDRRGRLGFVCRCRRFGSEKFFLKVD